MTKIIAFKIGRTVVIIFARPAVPARFFAAAVDSAPQLAAAAVVDVAALRRRAFVATALQAGAATERNAVQVVVTLFTEIAEPIARELLTAAVVDKSAFILPALLLAFTARPLANEFTAATVVSDAALVRTACGSGCTTGMVAINETTTPVAGLATFTG